MNFEMPEWEHLPLGEVLTLKRGYDLPQQRRETGDVPIVSSSGISGFHSTAKVCAPGVVTGRYGTIGEVFYVDRDFWPLNTALYVEDFKGNEPRFCAALLKTLNFHAHDGKSGVPGVNRNDLHAIEVTRPPVREQQRITEMLTALDDKIDSNRRLAKLLEETAATLFRAWFVDFVGVEEFEDSEIGPIPRGWRSGRLGDIAVLHRSLVGGENTLPYIGLDAMPRRSTVLSEWTTEGAPTGQASVFRAGDVLFGKLRPYFHKVGVAPVDGRCSTEILVLRPREPDYYALLLGHVASPAFIDHCVSVSRGTRMPRAEWKDASTYKLPIPPTSATHEFDAVVRTIYAEIVGLTHESRTLAAVRDALLPKLISGEIRVPDTSDPAETFEPPFA